MNINIRYLRITIINIVRDIVVITAATSNGTNTTDWNPEVIPLKSKEENLHPK
jgi:hypothetical protein